MIENKLKIAIAGNVDAGKCFAENTILLDNNQSHIKAKEIKLGDKLLGYKDDVTVINIHKGWGKLYRIKLLNRDIYFDVTYNHQLVLKYMDIEKILSKNEYFELMNYNDEIMIM